ncbi:hypothetical protein [Tropicimonas sp. IMCC6043]|uniref:hypothetical protein n=1 Tax=Tropicimonas sp. IMCC6043 TaxID=2510645 RepID=UPI00101DE59B|nr:hypothetical protein [Tropicimonas sp. IMCC6043]RYH06338.1 hypothetical protein EU800_24190 [Tropicimonas sp. IMCC6043]
MILLVGVLIWTGGIPMALAISEGMVPSIALIVMALGVIVGLRGLFAKSAARVFEVTDKEVRQTSGRGSGWSEPLSNFRGVRWRRRITAEDKPRHVLELVHSDPSRIVPLFARASGRANRLDSLRLAREVFSSAKAGETDTSRFQGEASRLVRQATGDDVRDVWEGLAALLGVPAIDSRGGEEESRAVADLDKSIADLASEGRVSRDWDDRPPPQTLHVERVTGEEGAEALRIEILASEHPWAIKPISYGVGGLCIVTGLYTFQFGAVLAGAIFIGIPFALNWMDEKSRRTITITRKKLSYTNPAKQGTRRKDFSVALSDIERIHIQDALDRDTHGTLNRVLNRGQFGNKNLIISSDQRERQIGYGLDDNALEWLRAYIVAAIANA